MPKVKDQQAAMSATEVARATPGSRPTPRIAPFVGNFAMQRALRPLVSVGRAGDSFENEADRVADAVMSRSPIIGRGASIVKRRPLLQRKLDEEAEEPPIDFEGREEDDEQELRIQARSDGSGPPRVTPRVESLLRGGEGRGGSLDDSTRAFFEPRLGHDFSDVRVHADEQAASAARAVNAVAFTHGRDIYFAAGHYEPESDRGRHLLAHELTHVVQQGAAGQFAVQRKEAVADSEEGDVEPLPDGTINRPGIVAGTAASPLTQYLRKEPSPEAGGNVVATLSFNDPVFVERRGGAGDAWYHVTTATNLQGWVPSASIALDPPEPSAVLYRVQPGDTPIDLARAWYGPFEDVMSNIWKPGWKPDFTHAGDARFYVGALSYANKGRAGFPSPADLGNAYSWKGAKLLAGHTIWKPGKTFLNSLVGKVSSGSITEEIWEDVKGAAGIVLDWLVYAAAFSAGVLYGAYESIRDLLTGIVDLIEMIYDLVKSVITGTILKDAAAFWEDLKQLKLSDLETWFLSKWNAADPWDQAFFRGEVLGYVIMEILMFVFSGGILSAIKWTGKFAKIGALIAKLPGIVKAIEVAEEAVKLPKKVIARVKAAHATKAAAKKLGKLERQLGGAAKLAEMLTAFGNDSERLVRFFTFFGEDAARLQRAIKPGRYQRVKDVVGEVEGLMKEFGSAKQVERALELSEDVAHGNLISVATIQEARVGLHLEARGLLKPKITRYPGEAAEFLDGNGEAWDVKGFVSGEKKGMYKLLDSMTRIEREFARGEKVIIDTSRMRAPDIAELKAAVRAKGWDVGSLSQVKWYP